MRYLLVLMLLVVAVSVCHGEDSKTEYSVSLDTTKINMGQQVDQVADALKKHLDGPLGMYYKAAVKKTAVSGVINVASGLLLLIIGVVALIMIVKAWFYGKTEEALLVPATIFGGIGVLFAIGIGIGLAADGAKYLFCPEYYAMNDILAKLATIGK